MCRWFAYISPTEECLLEDVLVTPAHAISKQVHDHYLPKLISHVPGEETTETEISLRNRLNNVDGFGLAWYTFKREEFILGIHGSRPALYKHSTPPTNDANFHSLCANTSTLALFAHIRAATATAVTPTNNHPFTFGRHTVMHNGVVSDFLDIRRDLLDLLDRDTYQNVHGTTDSEHLAALYMTHLTAGSGKQSWDKQYSVADMASALISTFTTIIRLQQKTLGKDKAEANSLNVCCTDGSQMIAFRFRNHIVEQPPSLYWSQTAGVTLNRKYPDNHDGTQNPVACKRPSEHGAHVIVASEPTTYSEKDWALIEKNHAILVDGEGRVTNEKIGIGGDLLAEIESTGPG